MTLSHEKSFFFGLKFGKSLLTLVGGERGSLRNSENPLQIFEWVLGTFCIKTTTIWVREVALMGT